MKALFFFRRSLGILLLLGLAAALVGCAPRTSEEAETPAPEEEWEASEDAPSYQVSFTLYSADGTPRVETFEVTAGSEHAAVYVSAHAVDQKAAEDLLELFETKIYPALSLPLEEDQRIGILLSHMEGQIYGYTPFPEPEEGPVVCLNALYPEKLGYALAHEYQHLCAHRACEAGHTSLSEATDELFSDVFCELLFPDQGTAHNVISPERAKSAQDTLQSWGEDGLLHAYALLREGYGEKELLSTMEGR